MTLLLEMMFVAKVASGSMLCEIGCEGSARSPRRRERPACLPAVMSVTRLRVVPHRVNSSHVPVAYILRPRIYLTAIIPEGVRPPHFVCAPRFSSIPSLTVEHFSSDLNRVH